MTTDVPARAPAPTARGLGGTGAYARVVMLGIDPATRAAGPSALATSALRLVGDGASAAVLAERFAAEGAVVEEARAAEILAELAALGLVRVARVGAESRVHVVTSLGRQLADAGAVIGPGVATQLADLEHLRTDLLSTIAHELRTPLTAVRTCVGILRDEAASPTDAERAMLLATIERNADRMQQIVGDILQIARFRTGEIVLQLRAFDAVDLARGAIASLAPLAAERGQSIVLDAPGGSVRVYGDHRRLDQALVNLVSNAGKYGREGGRIEVTVRAKGGHRDVGRPRRWPRHRAGGPAAPLRAVLRRPQRPRRGLARRGPRPPDGARDRPGARRPHRRRHRAGGGQHVHPRRPRGRPVGHRLMRILVVDDAPDVVESVALGFTLQWREVEVLGAATGEEALDLVETRHPDIVLLDVGMPGMDGFAALKEIRLFSDVPVVMLTARDDPMDKVKGLELGADDYVTKPFNHLELIARVRAVLRRHEMPPPTSRAPSFRALDLEVDFASHEARLGGERLDLTPTEYKLLYHLVRNAGHVLQHGTLLAKVWGREYVDEVDYLRVYVRRLREKLHDDPDHPRYIRTERGLGYRFIAQHP